MGKTLSARHYTRWDRLGPAVRDAWALAEPVSPELIERRTLFYTVSMTTTPKRLEQDVGQFGNGFKLLVGSVLSSGVSSRRRGIRSTAPSPN